MHTAWLNGYTDKDARKKQIDNYSVAYKELAKVLEQNFKKKEAVRDYSSPGWMQEQIAVNEYNQALNDILKLLKD